MTSPASPVLSAAQLETLAGIGEERTAAVGDVLFQVGDRRYPFIVILEGEAAIQDGAGNEIVRHGTSGFLGEMSLLSGQTAYLTAVVTQPMRYLAVDRDALRPLLAEDGPLGDLLLSTFMQRRELLQQRDGHRPRDHRAAVLGSHAPDRRVRAAQPDPAHVARPRAHARPRRRGADRGARAAGAAARAASRAGRTCAGRRAATCRARWASASSSRRARRSTSWSSAPGRRAWARRSTEPRRASTPSSSRAPRSAARPGASRRIENYLGFPAGIAGSELTSRAVTQARKFGARTATPYRAVGARAGQRPSRRAPRGRPRGRGACDRARDGRRVPAPPGRPARGVRGHHGLLCRRADRGTELRGLARRRDRRRQLGGAGRRLARARRRARDAAASPRGPARDDVRLPDPRARALRRRREGPQRDRRAARRGRRARGRHAEGRTSASRSPSSSSSSAPRRAPTGSATSSGATTRASS